MKEDKLISIVIPIYNSELYLEATLESVKVQTYSNIEVLMIDDGSNDTSPLICDRYAQTDSRFRAIHQVNKGPSAARNRGLDEAKGEYLTFLDNDDLIHQDFIKILYNLCEEHGCDIALTKSYAFLDESSIPISITDENLMFMDNKQLSEQLLDMGWGGLAVTMAKLFKRTLFENIRFNEQRIISDDDSTIYLLFWKAQKSVLFIEPLYFYRSKRKGSITHSGYSLSWLTSIDAFRERMEFYQKQDEEILYAKAMRNYCRKLAENYLQIKLNLPKEKVHLRNLRQLNRKQTRILIRLNGNSLKQKCSAILFAWIPLIWNFLYMKFQRKG